MAAARLGHHAAVVTKVGDDPFGGYVRAKLTELGVDTRFVGTDHVLRTPLAFAALTPPEDPELLFYREPAAPDMQLVPDDVDAATVRDVAVLWIAGSSMAEEPARSTVLGLLGATPPGGAHGARPRLPGDAVGRARRRRDASSAAPSTR